MSSEAQLVLDLWEKVRDHLPAVKRPEIAKDYLYVFAEYGFDAADLASIVDEDPDLTEAFEEVFIAADDEEYVEDE